MKYRYLTPILMTLALAACGGQHDNELSSSEEQAQMENASNYAAYADASAPPPDTLPDDYASGENAPQEQEPGLPANRTADYHAADKTSAHAVYDSTGDMPVVRLKINGQTETVLKQTDALPQGAVYSNGNITWETDGTSAELTQNGKTLHFTENAAHGKPAHAASAASGK